MTKGILFIAGMILSVQVLAQTGIGTTTPNVSAKLDVYSTNKGFLPPRVSLTDAYDQTTIPSPATGLLVYCKGDAGLAAGYYFWNGNAWATIATAGGNGSVAAEFGSQILQAGVTINTITPIDILSFTLPSAGTWEVITFLRAQGTAGYAAEFALYDASGILVPDSEILPAYGQTGSTGTGVVRITTTGAATYKLKAWASGGPAYPYNVTTDGNGKTGITWKKISGNAPVTGQSVDYGLARYTGSDGTSLSANAIVAFDASAAGNLAWSGNKFMLKANKTYELESYLSVYHASAGVAGVFQIYNYTNASVLASGLYISINGSGGYNVNGNGPMRCIITPTTDIEVGVRISTAYGGWPSIVGSTSTIGANGAPNQSYLLVKQIGSSAIVNPWTLAGTNTYNTTGNVGIGTTSPSNTLHLENGNSFGPDPGLTTSPSLYIYNNNNASTSAHSTLALRTNGNGGGNPYLSFDINGIRGYSMGIDNVDEDKFKFHTNWNLNNSSSPAFTVTADNRLGIGTVTPATRLHVKSSDMTSLTIESTSSDNYGMIQLNANTDQNWANNYHEFMFFQKQGTNIGSIVGANGGNMVSYNTSSDYRLKADFKNYNGLEIVNKIKTFDYLWKSDSSRMYGVIAHELKEVLPYAVSGIKDAVDKDGKIIPQSVDYSKLTPILVKAVQEQDIKIKELQLKIEALLKRLETVESKK